MAFGQQSGSPASAKQVQRLLELLHEAGHTDFRDARGPMGFTQRQAGGKFSRDEADAFIEQLEQESHESAEVGIEVEVEAVSKPAPKAAPSSAAEQAIRKFTNEQLAAELQRRGWIVLEP
jgi:hypothetical protein